jgi:hypothetical protein
MQTLVCEQLCLCALLANGFVVGDWEEVGVFRLPFLSFRACIQDKKSKEKDEEKQLEGKEGDSMFQLSLTEPVNNMLTGIQACCTQEQ